MAYRKNICGQMQCPAFGNQIMKCPHYARWRGWCRFKRQHVTDETECSDVPVNRPGWLRLDKYGHYTKEV